MPNIGDRFWIWGHAAGSHNQAWNIPKPSRMTPVEAAGYLGTPNLIMVRYDGRPAPPFDQYAVPMRTLRRVVWSIVGATGTTGNEERAHVFELAARFPNITGVMMDDFFKNDAHTEEMGTLSIDELCAVRRQLIFSQRQLDLWVVLYDYQLALPLGPYLRLCDKVTLWTWEAHNLSNLEQNLARTEALAPTCAKFLGCYLWDYGCKQSLPLDLMQRQCNLALGWLREGRIEGVIFLASCICDLELETVEWTRNWIAQVKHELLEAPLS